MIEIRARHLKTFLQKSIGLLDTAVPTPVYFNTRWGIHTFGMKYPIDVIILDNKNIVQVYNQHLHPNRVFFWSPVYRSVLELPGGQIQKKKIQKGSVITIVET